MMMNNLEEWIVSRPPAVQVLARKYPPGTKFKIHEQEWYVVGFTEQGQVQVSETDPKKDYEKAIKTRGTVCKCCVDKLDEARCE